MGEYKVEIAQRPTVNHLSQEVVEVVMVKAAPNRFSSSCKLTPRYCLCKESEDFLNSSLCTADARTEVIWLRYCL